MTKGRILIVEDDGIIVMHLSAMLSKAGYQVCGTYASGEETLLHLHEINPDLAILDMRLAGEMDGIETAEQILKLKDIPILFVTAFGEAERVEKAKLTHPYAYLLKPLREPDLLAAVEISLYKHHFDRLLRENEERYHSIFEGVQDAILVENREGIILQANQRACEMTGYPREQLIGMHVNTLVPPGDPVIVSGTETPDTLPGKPMEARSLRANGEIITVEITAQPLTMAGESLILVVMRDISERKRIESGLRQAQSLAQLGTLTAGIAHELNTPLQIITGLCDRLLRVLQDPHPDPLQLSDHVGRIRQEAWRMAQIIRSLQAFNPPAPVPGSVSNLNQVILDALQLLSNRLETRQIQVELHLDEHLPDCACSRDQAFQVVLNLLTNAHDAMPNGGTLTVTTLLEPSTSSIQMIVKDTGHGIPLEIQHRIFEPFFTTRPVGSGVGLGLCVAYGILKSLGGNLTFTSQPGAGTSFTATWTLKPIPSITTSAGRYET